MTVALGKRVIKFEPFKITRSKVTAAGNAIDKWEAVVDGIKILPGNPPKFFFTGDGDRSAVVPFNFGRPGYVIDFDTDRGVLVHDSTFAGVLWRWEGNVRKVYAVFISLSALGYGGYYHFKFEIEPDDVNVYIARWKRYTIIVRRAKTSWRNYTEAGSTILKFEHNRGVDGLWEAVKMEKQCAQCQK